MIQLQLTKTGGRRHVQSNRTRSFHYGWLRDRVRFIFRALYIPPGPPLVSTSFSPARQTKREMAATHSSHERAHWPQRERAPRGNTQSRRDTAHSVLESHRFAAAGGFAEPGEKGWWFYVSVAFIMRKNRISSSRWVCPLLFCVWREKQFSRS